MHCVPRLQLTKEATTIAVKPIPEGSHTVTPYLMVQGASKLIDFLKQAFKAEEIHRFTFPDGTVMHAQVRIGDSMVMMSEARAEHEPMPTMIYLYVEDVDTVYKRALQAGAISLREPTNEFYGDRSGGIKAASGNQWWIGTHIEDVSPRELEKRAEAFMKQQRRG
jgi:PhnB protein